MAPILGLLAFIFAVSFLGVLALYLYERRERGTAQHEKLRIEQTAKKALARYQAIADLEKHKADLETRLNQLRVILPRFQNLAEMERHREQLGGAIAHLQQTEADFQGRIAVQESTLADLKSQTESVEETLEMQSFGFYRPKYQFDDSEEYAHKLTVIRDSQKALVKAEGATHCPQEWTVDGSAAKGRKMVKEHGKLMLRAFNGECDAAVAKVKYDNIRTLENRINQSFDAVNKLGESKHLWLTREYLKLKLEELYLVHERSEKVQAEREEQRAIRERMREEEKTMREIEKAKEEAEREETTKTKALKMARQELAQAEGKQVERLQVLVERLETELKDALDRKAKAIARAQLTRSGYVYILSNVGSFGRNVFKIGMTRRLEPLERMLVK